MKLSSLVASMTKTVTSGEAPRESATKQLEALFPGQDPYDEASLGRFVARADRAQAAYCVDLIAKVMADQADPATSERASRAGRWIALSLKDRKECVAATFRLSSQDKAFMEHIRLGDASRDSSKWGEGELHYWRGLSLYPLHAGYRVQYAHCLKEQGKFVDAELQYRNALALGEVQPDLIRHLRFSAEKVGRPVNGEGLDTVTKFWSQAAAGGSPLDMPATERDIVSAGDLFLGRSAWPVAELAEIMSKAPLMSDVIAHFLQRPEFAAANRDLMLLLVESREARR